MSHGLPDYFPIAAPSRRRQSANGAQSVNPTLTWAMAPFDRVTRPHRCHRSAIANRGASCRSPHRGIVQETRPAAALFLRSSPRVEKENSVPMSRISIVHIFRKMIIKDRRQSPEWPVLVPSISCQSWKVLIPASDNSGLSHRLPSIIVRRDVNNVRTRGAE
jgi:hypothetical protein